MHIQCPKCDTEYDINASSIPTEGRDVQCSNCDGIWFQNSEITLQREIMLSGDDLEDMVEASFAKRKAVIILAGTGAAVALAAYVGLSVYQGQQKPLDADQPVELAQTDVAELPAPNAVGDNEIAVAVAPVDVANEEPVEAVAEVIEEFAKAVDEPAEVVDAPVEVSEEPIERAEAPTEIFEEPVEVQADVVETIQEPVEVTDAPVEVVEEPAKVADTPAEVEDIVAAVEGPAEIVDVPFAEPVEAVAQGIENAVEAAKAPVDAVDEPVKAADVPVVVLTEPVEAPVEDLAEIVEAPTAAAEASVDVADVPTEILEQPIEDAAIPAEQTFESVEIVEALTDIVEPKAEIAELPADAADAVVETAEEPAVIAAVPDKVDDATADVATASAEVLQPLDEPAQTSASPAAATMEAPKDALAISNAPPPSFDIVRVDAVGATVIAGTAEPMANVAIILNGKEFGRAKADKRGKFVALLSMPVSHDAQRLSLSAQVSGYVASASKENVILAPSGATPPETSVHANQPNNDQATVLPAQKAPAVLVSDPNGVRVMQPTASALKATDNLVIDAISYDALGVVQLEGRGIQVESSGFVRAYLDNKLIATGPVQENSSWQIDLAGIKAGIYTLRIDQVDAEGAVVSRVETSFQRESAMTLQNAQTNAQSKASLVTVQAGSTLWAIANDNYGDGALYVRVFEANRDHIRNPDLIYPGQMFELPQ